MKVSTSAPPPSRAGSLDLIADDLALDFANTESGRGFPSHENHLREAEHVAQWLKHAKALPAEDADWLKGEVSKRADLAAVRTRSVSSNLPEGRLDAMEQRAARNAVLVKV